MATIRTALLGLLALLAGALPPPAWAFHFTVRLRLLVEQALSDCLWRFGLPGRGDLHRHTRFITCTVVVR
jgi:hypothetical protein